ncbi:MAG: polysaccharide deacetylase family protein, partial [Bacteroidales bacterium]
MNKEKYIYLTFDDGPTPKATPWVLTLLDKYQFKATFFCLGKNAKQYPKLIEEIFKHGHTIGNHGYEHLNGWKTKNKIYIENVEKGAYILKSKIYRPPFGKISPLQWLILKKKHKIIFWHYLSKDYLAIE